MEDKTDIYFSMSGKVRKNRGNFYIDLHWQGERIRLFSDREGLPLDSERRAERLLAHIRYEIDHGLFDAKNYIKRELKALIFANYAETWLARRQREVENGMLSRSYFTALGYHIKNHLIPFIGGKSIRDINEGTIEDLFTELSGSLSPKSLANISGVLHKIFKDALRRRDIGRIPEFPKIDIPEPQTKWLTPEEQERVLQEITCPVRRAFFLFLMRQGCRPGEGRALMWQDIDWKRRIVAIHAAMDGEHYRPSTKEKDFRILPLSAEVMEALRLLPRSISGFVFTYNGKPLRKGLVNSTWRAAAKKAGIDVCCYQGTRHSVASQLVNDGTSLELISKLLGHKTGVSTRRYAHVNVETLRDLVDRQQTVSDSKKQVANLPKNKQN